MQNGDQIYSYEGLFLVRNWPFFNSILSNTCTRQQPSVFIVVNAVFPQNILSVVHDSSLGAGRL